MNADDTELLRELDARRAAQLAAAHACVIATDALIEALYRTRGTDPLALVKMYEQVRAAYQNETTRHAI